MSARVVELWQYPVKSAQGHRVEVLTANETGFDGDRVVGFLNAETGKLLSAKRHSKLFEAVGHPDRIELADGTTIAFADSDAAQRVSAWLGVPVVIARAGTGAQLSYEMSFGPFTDASPVIEIPAPPSTLLDLGAAHLLSTATLRHAAREQTATNWSVRRFRPNIVVETDGDEPFTEDGWVGHRVTIGGAVLSGVMTTIRCAMPLRAQPAHAGEAALDAQPGMFDALTAVHANFLGIYLAVEQPGEIRVGDAVIIG